MVAAKDNFLGKYIYKHTLSRNIAAVIYKVLSMEKLEHLGFLVYFGEKGSEKMALSQYAPFFANSNPDMPAVPVPATQVHDWLLQNIASTLEHICERASAKENGPSAASDQDVPMADACPHVKQRLQPVLEDSLRIQYERLHCELTPLDINSEEFAMKFLGAAFDEI